MGRMFDLQERVPLDKGVTRTIEDCRGFDLAARVSMYFPMERMVSLLAPRCPEGTRVVNICSQTGLFPLMLGGRCPGAEIHGIEEDELLVQIAEENMMLASLAKSPARVDIQQGDPAALPFDTGYADVLTGFMPFYRCDNILPLLKECDRVCKKDGLVFLYAMARDAEEGAISFVLQYIGTGQKEFMESLGAAYSFDEVRRATEEAGLTRWQLARESLNIRIASADIG